MVELAQICSLFDGGPCTIVGVVAFFATVGLLVGYLLPPVDRSLFHGRLMPRVYRSLMTYWPERFLFSRAVRQDETQWETAGHTIYVWRLRVWLLITLLLDGWLVWLLVSK